MKPIITEKAIKLIELKNTIIVIIDRKVRKPEIKKRFGDLFNVKIEKVNTSIRKGKKIAYIKLAKENPAIDIATKLGMI